MATPSRDQLRRMTREAAKRYGLDPAIFERQIEQESGFAPDVVSGARRSSAGAVGIAQIMPQFHPGVDPLNPAEALDYAARLMRSHLDRYNGSYELALAAYNAGPGNVDAHNGVPPFAETRAYVSRILGKNVGATPAVTAQLVARQQQPSGGGQAMDITNNPRVRAMVDEALNEAPVPTAASAAPGANPPQSHPILDMLQQQKGPFLRVDNISPRTIQKPVNPRFPDLGVEEVPNPFPTYRYFWPDGTYVDIEGAPEGGTISGGTALTALRNQGGATGGDFATISAPPTQQFIIQRRPDGTIETRPNPNFVSPEAEPFDPIAAERDRLGLEGDRLGLEASRLQLQQIRRAMQPAQQQLIQDAFTTIDQIRGQIASGQISPVEGNQFMDLVRQNLDAALKGTTMAEQAEAERVAEMARAELGRSILNQRVASGTGLAGNLLSVGSALAQSAMAPAGGGANINFDPFGAAAGFVNQLGGGQQIGDLASSLLMGAAGTGPTQNAAFPTTREAVLAQFPELGGGMESAAPAAAGPGFSDLVLATRNANSPNLPQEPNLVAGAPGQRRSRSQPGVF